MTGAAWMAAAWAAEGAAVLALAFLLWQPLPVAATLHGASALASARGLGGGRGDERFFVFALVLSLPLLGIAGLSAVRLWKHMAPRPRAYEEIHATLSELPGPELVPEPLDRVFEWLKNQLSVQPLADLIRSGDSKTRRWAIELLGKRGDGSAVELLREALQAEDPDTQIAASTALQRLEEHFTQQISQAQERASREPESAAAWAAAGDACRNYQMSRLLDPVMERHWLGQAEEGYRRALALNPGWRSPRLALAQVLLGQGRLPEAEALVRQLLGAEPSSEADLLLCEILFAQGRLGELEAACRSAVAAGRRDELLEWWAGVKGAAR
jgi:hypothetical protein